jgi:hypothetical protein
MEQNKYREQIQNSTIIPSDGSWDKLNKKLTHHDNDKINNKRLFMKYAASLLFIISIGFYFLPPENEISSDEIKASPKVDKSSIKSSVANTDPEPYPPSPTLNSTVIKKTVTKTQTDEIIYYKVEESVANNYEDNKVQNENSHKEVHDDSTTNTLFATSKNVHNIDTEYEVEELLKNANLNIEKNDQYLNKTKISAMVLLEEIEDDLEKETRRKLFEKIIITIKNPTEIEITDRSK